MKIEEQVSDKLKSIWGYEHFRPLQYEAVKTILDKTDSLVILPTGGGKSICYQLPALIMDGLAVVVSPLISLMKDQVDALVENGVRAGRLDSTQSKIEQQNIFSLIHSGELDLLYLSPERLMTEAGLRFLKSINISFFAIDEAHCVSMWGHDFRPEYTMLGELRESFPNTAVHCFTATATTQVKDDICKQLNLKEPEIFTGSFFRPNLKYQVKSKNDALKQIIDLIEKHPDESGIIYCITRKETEKIANSLIEKNINAVAYHAGLEPVSRKQIQDGFIREKYNVIVATVAFGMGIDKSNVRFVIHNGMPKSLEHYQQESGRAGRDGLEADCLLLWSGRDFSTWKFIFDQQEDLSVDQKDIILNLLRKMQSYCSNLTCRHKGLLEYFGEELEGDNCAACDVCLGNLETIDNSLEIAQKILSCIVRLNESFGAEYTALVLAGSKMERILENEHNELSTYGILKTYQKRDIRQWIEQLTSQAFISKIGEYNILKVTSLGWELIRGEKNPTLLKQIEKKAKSKKARQDWEGVDQDLFQLLRELRREIADIKEVPAFVVFGDKSLREMARYRPTTIESFLEISGVGIKKAEDYGLDFTEVIRKYCRKNNVETSL